ncbi:Solute carrier family 41 member 3 [Bos mutus]|uniref:Solute carrier family 41 member n=1 Tax=Bos mutus TaxID=72004 RepID=L8HL61_9CETA|nr:Solute carrier family 41 member 3 [Bos mutus]
MAVTRLSLELRFQGGRLRGVRCELARWPRGAPPEPAASIVGQGTRAPRAWTEPGPAPQHWPVFTEMKDLLTLVPPLVGLKGNLEMTLASRLSTAANTGQIDDPREQYRVVSSNLALVQVQAAVVGLLAAVAALLLGLASGQGLDVVEAQVLCASSVLTASLAACALGPAFGSSPRPKVPRGLEPRNHLPDASGTLGDLITLSLLAVVSSFFYRHRGCSPQAPGRWKCTRGFRGCGRGRVGDDGAACVLRVGGARAANRLPSARSLGGLILNKTLSQPQFRGMAVFAPIMCGVGGNLVAIQTSRISTHLHLWGTPGVLPLWMKKCWPSPCSTFCSSEINATSARVLLVLVVPGHLAFFSIVSLLESQSVPSERTFVLLYLLAGLVQVTVLLHLADVAVRLAWRRALDPDDHCIPYLTGLGDLLGTGLLALCFLAHGLLRTGMRPSSPLDPAPGPS